MLDRTAYRNAVVKLLPYDTIGEEPEADLVGKPKLSEDDAMIVYGCATRFFDENIPLSSFTSQPISVKLLEVVVHSALSAMLSVTTQKAARRPIFELLDMQAKGIQLPYVNRTFTALLREVQDLQDSADTTPSVAQPAPVPTRPKKFLVETAIDEFLNDARLLHKHLPATEWTRYRNLLIDFAYGHINPQLAIRESKAPPGLMQAAIKAIVSIRKARFNFYGDLSDTMPKKDATGCSADASALRFDTCARVRGIDTCARTTGVGIVKKRLVALPVLRPIQATATSARSRRTIRSRSARNPSESISVVSGDESNENVAATKKPRESLKKKTPAQGKPAPPKKAKRDYTKDKDSFSNIIGKKKHRATGKMRFHCRAVASCKYYAYSLQGCQAHIRRIHWNHFYRCTLCGLEKSCPQNFRQHMLTEHGGAKVTQHVIKVKNEPTDEN